MSAKCGCEATVMTKVSLRWKASRKIDEISLRWLFTLKIKGMVYQRSNILFYAAVGHGVSERMKETI